MTKYIIRDWVGNTLFKKAFNSEDSATDYMCDKLDEDSIEDVFVCEVEGEMKNNKFYPDN